MTHLRENQHRCNTKRKKGREDEDDCFTFVDKDDDIGFLLKWNFGEREWEESRREHEREDAERRRRRWVTFVGETMKQGHASLACWWGDDEGRRCGGWNLLDGSVEEHDGWRGK